MVRRIQEPFGKAGLIVAMVALVAAIGGSAIAANTASDSGKRNAKAKKNKKKKAKGVTVQQVRKISKQEARKFANSNPGAPGVAGPQGPAGANGAQGPKGDKGAQGSKGDTGDTGPQGSQGPKGDPWTPEGTLPGGATLTGSWAFGVITEAAAPPGFGNFRIPISFSIPLAEELSASQVHYINAEGEEIKESGPAVENPPDCTGSVGDPTAAAGHLCVYTAKLEGATAYTEFIQKTSATDPEVNGASTAGAMLTLLFLQANSQGFGTWAVTAEEE